MTTQTVEQILEENQELRRRLEEAEQALRAIRAGEVDAVLVETDREQVFTLETADKPYRLLVEQMPQAAATLTVEGAILYCNRRFAGLLQRPLQALLGKPFHDFVTPDSRPLLDSLLRDGRAAEAQGEVTLERADDTPVPVFLGVGSLEEGALGLCLMVTDLTEQRHYQELQRTQAALRASEERLAGDLADAQRLQEISTRLIQEGDAGHFYDQILDAAIGVMRSDMASMQVLDEGRGALRLLAWRGFGPEFARTFDRVYQDMNTSCGVAWRGGRRVVVPDVETCHFIVGTPALEDLRKTGIRAAQSTPLVARDGCLLGMISTHWRTPHEPTERDLRLLDVLARQAADLIERRRAEQALRDADRRKDEFLATLAHELRNPLAPIRNALQVLKVTGPTHPEMEWGRDVIDRQVQLMARLLEDLLDVSRISRNQLELRKERSGAGTTRGAAADGRLRLDGAEGPAVAAGARGG